MTGSIQLRSYLHHRDAGMSREEAAELVGFGAEEARLTDLARDRGELADVEPAPFPLDHNQPKEPEMSEGIVAADELRLLIERIERLEEEKKAIADDVKDVYLEAKSRGYDVKTMRTIVRLRKMEAHHRQEAMSLLETYANALGIQLALI